MKALFIVLNHARGIMLKQLDEKEVCAVLQYLMLEKSVSFDVALPTMVNGRSGYEFVTCDFEETHNGQWVYRPKPRELSEGQ